MKVNTVNVDSYGGIKNRSFELGPGLNVFYGPNEAGKSSLRSFITTTMFPKAPLKYPTQKGSDSGTLVVTLLNGDVVIFRKDGKRSSGVGSEICNIDDKEYISIYSLTPEDLRDVKSIEKGDIRNRFLTIPGGADIPRAYESLDEERTKLLPDTKRSSKCDIALLIQAEHELTMKVRRLQSREAGDGHYSELVEQKNHLKGELERLNIKLRACDEARTAAQRIMGRADDLANLEKLTTREKELLYAEKIDTSRITVLDSDIQRYSKELEAVTEEIRNLKIRLNGHNPEYIVRNRDKIERLDRLSMDYDFYKRRSEKQKQAVENLPAKRSLPVLTFAGAALLVAGIGVTLFNTMAGVATIAVGAIIAIVGLKKKTATPKPIQHSDEKDERVMQIEELLENVARDTNIERRGFHADVRLLMDLLKISIEYGVAEKKFRTIEIDYNSAVDSIKLYLSGFGGREGYLKAVSDNEELKDVRSKIEILRESISHLDIQDVPDEQTAQSEYAQVLEEQKRILGELARVEQILKDIDNDESVEEAITACSDAGDAVYAASYKWARLMMEKLILDAATSDAYGNSRPEVMERADRLLSAMTEGKYRLNTDPRVTETSIIDNRTSETKTVKEWSSGLEDQVKLAVKMSVALNLSPEKPPVILDDVLLTSDSKRKKNACEALSILAEDIQVLYFTCDRETRDFMHNIGARVLDL